MITIQNAAHNATSQAYLPLRSQLLPAVRVTHGRVVRREVGVGELQLSTVGPWTAAATLRFDVLEFLAGVGFHFFASQEYVAFESLPQGLRRGRMHIGGKYVHIVTN